MPAPRLASLLTAAGFAAALIAPAALAQSQPAGPQVLTFRELTKGSTFQVIDNPPRSAQRNGFPTRFSAGDEFIFTAPLADARGKLGELRAVCTVTHATSVKKESDFDKTKVFCRGVFVTRGGALFLEVANTADKVTRGAITGGTGAFVGARGTFTSTERKDGHSDDVVTLLP